MAETFYILCYVDNLLQVLVLAVVEDRVVYDDAVDVRVGIGGQDGLFDIIPRHFAESVAESTVEWKESKLRLASSSASAVGPGMMVIFTPTSGARRRTIWVAKRVQRSLAIGKDRPVNPSKREDFPLD